MADVQAAISSLQLMQATLALVQSFNLTTWRYPPTCSPPNGTSFDFIVVGVGSAGSVLVNRLSADSSVSVLGIETGGYPTAECDDYPGLFAITPLVAYDYNHVSQNDNYTAQNLQNKTIGMTAGKILGGTSSLHHLMHIRGFPQDYDEWAELLGDDSWNYNNLKPYLNKIERLTDEDLIKSPYYSDYFGTNGTFGLTRQTFPTNVKYLKAFKELGHNIENITTNLGYAELLYYLADGVRQSSSVSYLEQAKSRSNICLSLLTTATKILIENGVAVGVQVTKSNGETNVFYANKEVVVSAGVVNSPKLLMLSGIGAREHLDSKGIPVMIDLPGVGQNFQDPPAASVVYQMEESTATAAASDPHGFPLPSFVGLVALNSSQELPDYLSFNFEIPHDSTDFIILCVNALKYSYEICQKWADANKGRTLLLVINEFLMPESRGEVLLASADPDDAPLIYFDTFSKKSDLTSLAQSLKDYHKVVASTYFKSVNASMVDLGFCSGQVDDDEFWECYALAMSNTIWHYCGTCAMGSVLDNQLQVKGVEHLRVADASSMPRLIRGKINPAVVVIAERAADLIIKTWNLGH